MKFIESTVKRPIATVMLYMAILLLSVFALSKLKLDFLPDFTFPALTVMTQYPNVGPAEIEETITRRVEEACATVQNVKKVKSTSAEGISIVSIEFEWGTDIAAAAMDVREKLEQIRRYMPEESEKPIVFKFDMSMIPVMAMTLETDNVGLGRRFSEDFLKTEFEQVPGVAQVRIQGGAEREIQIKVIKNRLNAFNLTFSDIINTVAMENVNTPGGDIDIDRENFTIRTVGEYKSLRDIQRIVIAIREYKQIPVGLREIVATGISRRIPIYLENIAEVVDSYKEKEMIQTVNNVEGITLLFQKQSGANTVEVVNRIKEKFARIKSRIPSNMKLYQLFNTGDRIKRSISSVSDTALIGGIIALIVLFIFLRNIKATLVVGIAMPLSIIATFLLMYMNGITLNMMSFGGLALGVGMLVDNAVVVLENIFRHREKGETAEFSSINGAQQVVMPITASTMTTVMVFLPVLFVEGIAGVLFKEMALTVTFSLLASLVVAVSLIPMMSSKLLAGKSFYKEKKSVIKWLDSKVESVILKLEENYSIAVNWVIDHKKTILFGALGILFATFMSCKVIPRGFMPQNERDNFYFDMELRQGTRLKKTEELTKKVSTMINERIKGVRYVSARAGTGDDWFSLFQGKAGSHLATIRVVLPDRGTPGRRSMFVIQEEVRNLVKNIPGVEINFYRPSMMGSNAPPVEIQIMGHNLKTAMELANKIKTIVESVKGAKDAQISRKQGKKELVIHIDRIKASSLGLSVKAISNSIKTGFAGTIASRYRERGDEIDINVRFREKDRLDVEDLKRLMVKSPLGFKVPLHQIAKIKQSRSPVTIERLSQQRVIYVTANVDVGLENVVNEIQTRIRNELYPLPPGFNILYGSEYKDQQESFADLGLAFIIAILLVYMVMAAQFESLKHPFIILFTIPLSLVGVTLMFILTGDEFNIMGYLGAIILVGIVVNNAIVLVDYINLLRRDYGYSLRNGIIQGGKTRLRPILMTTLTTILGLFPMAFLGGEGSETREPMARAIIGGLFTSSLLTLFVMPVLYHFLEKRAINKRRVKNKEEKILEQEGGGK